jgi:transcriptional regulator with XRE-family HTH domain
VPPPPTLAQLGSAIRSLREDRELSIEALADEIGIHWHSVSRIERGKQNLTWTTLTGIAVALEVDLVELVRLASSRAPEPA